MMIYFPEGKAPLNPIKKAVKSREIILNPMMS